MNRNYQQERQELIDEIISLRIEISHLEILEKFIQTNSITEYTPNIFKEQDEVINDFEVNAHDLHRVHIEFEKIN